MRLLRSAAKRLCIAAAQAEAACLHVLRGPQVQVYYAWPDFARKAAAIAELLRGQGIRAATRTGLSVPTRARVRGSRDLWIGFWNMYPAHWLPRRYIFFNAEPLGVRPVEADWYGSMEGAIEVWDYSQGNRHLLASLSTPRRYVPFGYAPSYERSFARHTAGCSHAEDIDILFVGLVSTSPRRVAMLDRLRSTGKKVHVVTYPYPLWGRDLDRVIARAKIVVGIHHWDRPEGHLADYARLDQLIANRRFVVYERPSMFEEDKDFEDHVTTCTYDEIPGRCLHYLSRPTERRRISESAYDWFRAARHLNSFLPYDHIRKLLQQAV